MQGRRRRRRGRERKHEGEKRYARRNSQRNHVRVRKVKIKLPGGDVIWNRGYREKGDATSVGGSRRISLFCAIDFKNKMAIGQRFCLSISDFFLILFFLSLFRRRNAAQCGISSMQQNQRVFYTITREFLVSDFFLQMHSKRIKHVSQYRGEDTHLPLNPSGTRSSWSQDLLLRIGEKS